MPLPNYCRAVAALFAVVGLFSLSARGQDSDADPITTPFRLHLSSHWQTGLNGASVGFPQGATATSAWQPGLTLDGRGASRSWLGGAPGNAMFTLGRQPWQAHGDLWPRPGEIFAYGIGHRTGTNSSASLLTTHEENFGLSQRTTHALWQSYPSPSMQITVDLFHRRGDSELLNGGLGIAATLDYRGFFLQFARDPNFNFSSGETTRVSLGVRF